MTESLPIHEIGAVQARLAWMREARIWPNGLRYLWTDAFGVVLLVSLWHELHDDLACVSRFPGRFLQPAGP